MSNTNKHEFNAILDDYIKEEVTSTDHQSEDSQEKDLIARLMKNGYERSDITNEEALINNLKAQLEALNNLEFSNNEWEQLLKHFIAPKADEGPQSKAKRIHKDHIFALKKDDGSEKNIYLINKEDLNKNRLQVINQYENKEGRHENRYDVTILVNGLPLVHIELKKRGKDIKEAFNQIARYQSESFSYGRKLFEYVQIFVVSNGTYTQYYANSARKTNNNILKQKNFKFANYWADANNNHINDIADFANTFLNKNTLLCILTKYCVYTAKDDLIVMRPYQIAATEKIIDKIKSSIKNNNIGTIDAGGYIWHSTGSGKTLTSFKVAQLASTNIKELSKVLFIVDRKDLDDQTIKEYNTFSEGSADSTVNTTKLAQQLASSKHPIIVTTIQKLTRFIKSNPNHQVFNEHVALIFDECHRSQFGSMHKEVINNFKKYNIFGFTGTPILTENAKSISSGHTQTTKEIFGKKLHSYTIINAISDENILPFKVDYCTTFNIKDDVKDEKVASIDVQEALQAQERIDKITENIIQNFPAKTKQDKASRFNAMLATGNIEMAKKYYMAFKKQAPKLKTAIIYSFDPNEQSTSFDDDTLAVNGLEKSSKDFLNDALKDYNNRYGQSFDISADKFSLYYKDLSARMKAKEIDLLIVVNMFLTGFDAPSLNTLWVDKKLEYHGLLQAFSRTNRTLNDTKAFGQVICFQTTKEDVNDALELFGNKDANEVAQIKTYTDYYEGYIKDNKHVDGYVDIVEKIKNKFPHHDEITSDENIKEFVKLWGAFLRIENIITCFEEFTDDKIMLTEREKQDYLATYKQLKREHQDNIRSEKVSIINDLKFEVELAEQVNISIDYILDLIIKKADLTEQERLDNIERIIKTSDNLYDKKDLIIKFIKEVSPAIRPEEVQGQWSEFVAGYSKQELADIIKDHNLKSNETKEFLNSSFSISEFRPFGPTFTNILPNSDDIFNPKTNDNNENIAHRLKQFFNKYLGFIHTI